MKSGKRNQLAEKMAGEITLSDSPGHALKKWRMNFEIAPGVLSERLGVSPSVISDYESGRRKSPGTAVVGKIVDTLLNTDEETGGKHIEKFSTMLFSASWFRFPDFMLINKDPRSYIISERAFDSERTPTGIGKLSVKLSIQFPVDH